MLYVKAPIDMMGGMLVVHKSCYRCDGGCSVVCKSLYGHYGGVVVLHVKASLDMMEDVGCT